MSSTTATTTSLLHTALQNLHVAQQMNNMSLTPRPPSSIGSPRVPEAATPASPRSPPLSHSSLEDDDTEYAAIGKGTAPGTPLPGQKGLFLSQDRIREGKKDPLRSLPTHLAVRVFLQLDIKSLARCDRVCKRWHKSSTLNYVWFLQNRALVLPSLLPSTSGKLRQTEDGTEFFDPYDKSRGLATLPAPPLPTTATPQWSKAESKRTWKTVFRTTLNRDDEPRDRLRVNIDSLHSSGYSTPARHAHAGTGSGQASRWDLAGDEGGTGALTPGERRMAAREGYKAMGGRKSRGKRRMGGEMGAKDRTGALIDDGRFDAPW